MAGHIDRKHVLAGSRCGPLLRGTEAVGAHIDDLALRADTQCGHAESAIADGGMVRSGDCTRWLASRGCYSDAHTVVWGNSCPVQVSTSMPCARSDGSRSCTSAKPDRGDGSRDRRPGSLVDSLMDRPSTVDTRRQLFEPTSRGCGRLTPYQVCTLKAPNTSAASSAIPVVAFLRDRVESRRFGPG
jgi:hypothetical protein